MNICTNVAHDTTCYDCSRLIHIYDFYVNPHIQTKPARSRHNSFDRLLSFVADNLRFL